MRAAQDKFNEARYHFWRAKDKLDQINGEKDYPKLFDLIAEFRYEINSYVNSHRATTFALQAEMKSKYGDKFLKWYERQLIKITSDEFSKILKELRNINQKEGNKFPTFEFKGESESSVITFEIDFTNPDGKFITKTSHHLKKPLTIEISPVKSGEDPNFISDEDRRRLFVSSIKFYAEESNKILLILLYQIKLAVINHSFGRYPAVVVGVFCAFVAKVDLHYRAFLHIRR
jgi:hypothetical protein